MFRGKCVTRRRESAQCLLLHKAGMRWLGADGLSDSWSSEWSRERATRPRVKEQPWCLEMPEAGGGRKDSSLEPGVWREWGWLCSHLVSGSGLQKKTSTV